MRYMILIPVMLLTLGMAQCQTETDTPEKQLAAAEIDFQGVQTAIQQLAVTGVITPEIAPCTADANALLHSGLESARRSVRLEIESAGLAVSAFSAAMVDLRAIIVQIEQGTYKCQFQLQPS